MGNGKAKAHEAFAVTPSAAPAVPEGLSPLSADDLAELAEPSGPASAMLGDFDQALAQASSAAGAGPGPEQYAALKAAAEEAAAHLAQAAAEGVPAQLLSESEKELKKLTTAYLSSLDPEALQALAAAEGFEHPTLVGLNAAEGGAHPLAHWLDPAYPPQTPSKLKIQAKAAERYGELAAGATIGGQSLADVQAAEAAMATPAPTGGWAATPVEALKASAALHQALAEFNPHAAKPTGDDGGLAALVAAENHLATAQSAELGSDLEAAQASAKASVDKALGGLCGMHRNWAVSQLVEGAQAEGALSEAEAKLLTPTEQLAYLRASTPAAEHAGLAGLAGERTAQLAKLGQLKAAYAAYQTSGAKLGLAPLDSAQAKEEAASFAAAAGAYFEQRAEVAAWAGQVAAAPEVTAVAGHSYASSYERAQLTKGFRAWAKEQKLADLRAVAASMGMSAEGASRAQVQNYIAAGWDPSLDKADIAAAVAAASAKKTAPPPPAPAKAPSPPAAHSPAPSKAGPGPPPPASAKSFAAKHLQIVEALKAHQAVAADLPPRPPAAEVEAWSFGPAQAAHLGGGHTKSLHTAPDGSVWMFKPDKTGGGARAHAEAASSEIFARAGVPSVAVYARSIGGKMGSVQPLVEGATTLSPDPKTWSQADVDNLVRYHVAAWAVGDHDGNPANVIRTPSGGLCPVDQGQAFKFYGRDRLAADYHPNNSYGSVPVFHQAYAAAQAGQLGKGVSIRPEAALPAIKAFERMPDSAYRAILAPVATEGVKHGVHWVEPMRKAAQKRLGKTHVGDADVAEEFLRTAVARKNSLRASFAGFFKGVGFAGGAKLEKVA